MNQSADEVKLYCPACGTQMAVYRHHDIALCCRCNRQYTKMAILRDPDRFRGPAEADVPYITEVKDGAF